MSKPVHYKPTGYAIYCREAGAVDFDTAMSEVSSVRATTDIRRVTCPLCLHAIAGSMIRKGVPIRFTSQGKLFYEQFIPVPKPRDGEERVV
jgi:hypothetical protein